MVAIFGDEYSKNVFTEDDWPDPNTKLSPYAKSKYLAEKTAWDFVEERKRNNLDCFELVVINPGYVMVHSRIFMVSEHLRPL